MASLYSFSYITPSGQVEPLGQYQGKILLLVNTASRCGFSHQFEGLEKLYQDFKDSGLEIIAFPCNQFANQEPLKNEEIISFCQLKYDVSFAVSAKIDVNGVNADPIFKYLKENSSLHLNLKEHLLTFVTRNLREGYEEKNDIRWNFTKFLINKQGNVLARFEPSVSPKHIGKFIQRLL